MKKSAFTTVKSDATVALTANISVKCIHTPGHTKGSMCLQIVKTNHLITGDTLFCG